MEDLQRLRGELRAVIYGSGLKQSYIERRSGWRRGYLSSLLRGRVALRVEHLLVLARVLGREIVLSGNGVSFTES